jgi:Sialic acid synthase
LFGWGTGGGLQRYGASQILFLIKIFDNGRRSFCWQKMLFTRKPNVKYPKFQLNRTVEIKGRQIGDGHKTFIIAEAGLIHNGSLKLAMELVSAAKRTDCDAVKFQTFKSGSRISAKVKAVKYAETVTGLEETLDQMFNRLAMPFEHQKELFEYGRELGVEVFSTPFDFDSVDFLESMEVKLYKISSMDLVNLPLIKYVAQTGKPIILSTGMSTLGQIEEAVNVVVQEGNQNLILLHCNSSYPASPDEMNLNVICNLKKTFNIPIGLSDHTFGLFVSHTAIVLGANLIERHFTLKRNI